MFVVEASEKNVCDQKWVELELLDRYGINSMRKTLAEIGTEAVVDGEGRLWIRHREVGLVYYRTGYQMEQYAGEKDWATRLVLEESMAVKCPSIDLQLATFKKFQQVFGDKGFIDKVNREAGDKVGHLFRGIWALEEAEEVRRKAVENPHQYVIKP